MKRYRAKFNPDAANVFAVSLVEEPAMEGNFIAFSEQKEIKFKTVDEDKRRVMGLILEPNKEIYRNQNGEQFTITFTEQDVEDVAYNFQKQGFQNNSTIGHDGNPIKGVSFVETWLVENPEKDKSTNFGFSYPKGSWMGVMQLDNDEVYNDYVKTGKVKGFSIDALMQLEEINLKSNINMSEDKSGLIKAIEKVGETIALAFKPKEVDEVKEEVKLAENDLPIDEKDKLKEDEIVEEIKAEKVEVDVDDFIAKVTALLKPMTDEVLEMKSVLAELKKENETLKGEVVELGKQPATQTVKKAPTQVDFSKMTAFEKYKYYKQNG